MVRKKTKPAASEDFDEEAAKEVYTKKEFVPPDVSELVYIFF
jgi:hypothetical protein